MPESSHQSTRATRGGLKLARARPLLGRLLRSSPEVALPVYTYLDLSSAHTRTGELETLLELTAGAQGPRTIAHHYGAWVNVPGHDDADDSLDEIREQCPEIVNCLRYARALGCWWINFDADAAEVEALARFDHGPHERNAGAKSQPPTVTGAGVHHRTERTRQ